MTDNTDYVSKFINRTKKHIERVNKYAKKINKTYPNHDADKLDENKLLYMYSLMFKPDITVEERNILDRGTFIHVITNDHHPEYWTTTDLRGFTRKNFCPNGIVDATKMPNECIEQMICDWCAMSEEFGNTPLEWANKVVNIRWKFTPQQINLIYSLIETLWKN